MTNRIVGVRIVDHALIPGEADLRVIARTEFVDPGTEIRGRLLGPRCLFAETIEVAYPLRRLATSAGQAEITSRVVIPEASFWDPASPHLYVGIVEMWQDGTRIEEVRLRHGLRDLRATAHGLRLNGRPLPLRGREVRSLTEDEALTLRRAEYNLLLADATEDTRPIWEIADRVGFFVLGQPVEGTDPTLLADLAGHPSHLGWIAPGGYEIESGSGQQPVRLYGSSDPVGYLED